MVVTEVVEQAAQSLTAWCVELEGAVAGDDARQLCFDGSHRSGEMGGEAFEN